MRKSFLFCFLFLAWVYPVFADEVAYTSDGKTVILRDDGTYRIMDPSYQSGRYKSYGSSPYRSQTPGAESEDASPPKTVRQNRSQISQKPKKKGIFDKLIADDEGERGGPPKSAIKR